MKNANALAQIRQFCRLGLHGAAFMPSLLRAIRQLVPSDSAGFFWVDEAGEMADLFAEKLLSPAQMRNYFERHYDGPHHSFRERFNERAARHDNIVSFSPDEAFEQSAYYQETLQPLDAHHALYAIARAGNRSFGQLSLYRSKPQRPFGEMERTALAGAMRYITRVLSAPYAETEVEADNFRESDLEALIVCNALGEVLHASAHAFGLLARASGKPINRHTIGSEVGQATAHLLASMSESLRARPPASVRTDRFIDNRWGRFRLRAYPLDGSNQHGASAVLIQQQTHYLVRLAEALGTFPLSVQQREVALLIAQGLSNAEVAALMGISSNTASYHIKQLYQKLDANGRESAIARIEAAASTSSA